MSDSTDVAEEGDVRIPGFLSANNLKPFLPNDLGVMTKPVLDRITAPAGDVRAGERSQLTTGSTEAPVATKRCSSCRRRLPFDLFSPRKDGARDGYRAQCRRCQNKCKARQPKARAAAKRRLAEAHNRVYRTRAEMQREFRKRREAAARGSAATRRRATGSAPTQKDPACRADAKHSAPVDHTRGASQGTRVRQAIDSRQE